MIVFHRG